MIFRPNPWPRASRLGHYPSVCPPVAVTGNNTLGGVWYHLARLAPSRPGLPMPTDPVTVWIVQLQAGDPVAVRPLFEKYFVRLVGLARARLRDAPRRAADEEDLALSAFDSFVRGAGAGKFPDLADRDSLWRLLATFTTRRVAHLLRDAARLKRGGGAARDGRPGALEEVLGRDPDPALAAEVADECDRLLAALGGDDLRRIALLRMDGHSVEEVAAAVGIAPRSVKRKLAIIRVKWEEAGCEPA